LAFCILLSLLTAFKAQSQIVFPGASWEHRTPKDWQSGDPDWGNGKGKAIIGALNYLASQHVNSIYFLPMNIGRVR